MNPSVQSWKKDTVTMEAPRILALHSRNHGARNCKSQGSQRSRRSWQMHWPTKVAPEKVHKYEPRESMFKHETIVVCNKQKRHSFEGSSEVESAVTCSMLGAACPDLTSDGLTQSENHSDPENEDDIEDEADDAVRIGEEIANLKDQMQSSSKLMDNALQETSILRTELTQMQDDLHKLCDAFMSDDFDVECAARKPKISRFSPHEDHENRILCKEAESTTKTIIHPMKKSDFCFGGNIEGALKSTVSVEMCGCQEFLAASCIVRGDKSLEEQIMMPVPRVDDDPTTLTWSEGLNTTLTIDGSLSFPSVQLQSLVMNTEDVHSLFSQNTDEEYSEPSFGEYTLSQHTYDADCRMEMCDTADTGDELIMVEDRSGMDINQTIGLDELQNDCNKWVPEDSFTSKQTSAACGLGSLVQRDSISKLDSMTLEDSFGRSSMHCGSDVHCENVEVFEHCVCNAQEESVWSVANASNNRQVTNAAWMDAVEELQFDSTSASRDNQSAKLFNKSSQSAWDSAKASLERSRPVESLILPDIEAHAPRVLSGTWDSARQYDISKAILGDEDTCNFNYYDGQVHNLFYKVSEASSEDILRSYDSAINFENGNRDGQMNDVMLTLKASAPSKAENNPKSTKVRKGLGKGVCSESSCNTSSCCNANMLPRSVDKGEHASPILLGGNKFESKCTSSTGRWLDRVYQGFSSIASGMGIHGVAAESTVVSGNAYRNEFELVEMNGGLEWEDNGLDELDSHSNSVKMVRSRHTLYPMSSLSASDVMHFSPINTPVLPGSAYNERALSQDVEQDSV